MHIKKLEIAGFKSFVERTVIHFDHDLIGIVGPNGCGKSNVVDAIRWALGEQSAKALRGRAMGDVIFNGSDERPQAGFAEVTLTFDNSDAVAAQLLPLEYRAYAEIAVTRRLCRGDGENEYFVNKVPVRLRDVTDLFLGTGVGRKAYSIVEQGKIGLIVSARPDDRRVLIEEAAGITKYKAHKRQAETKMEATRQNLARVVDIIAEIERQLESLKRQAAKARRYVRYREELDDLQLWDASHKLLELSVRARVAGGQCASVGERARAERAAVDARDAEVEVLRQRVRVAEQAAERAQADAFATDNEARSCEIEIDRGIDRYRMLARRLEEAFAEERELAERAEGLGREAAAAAALLEVERGEQRVAEEAVERRQERLGALEGDVESAEAALAERRTDCAEAMAAAAAARERLGACERRGSELEERAERLCREEERLERESAAVAARRAELAAEVVELEARRQATRARSEACAAELPRARAELEAAGRELDGVRDAVHGDASRLRALEELVARREGMGAGVRRLLERDDPTVLGLLVDRIEVPSGLTAAFAAFASDRLECVLVADAQRGLCLLDDLARERAGRATLIARGSPALGAEWVSELLAEHEALVASSRRPPLGAEDAPVAAAERELAPWEAWAEAGARRPLPAVTGACLADCIGFAAEDAPAVRALFGSVLLATSREDADALVRSRPGHDIVTLDGLVFHADGRRSGGSGDPAATGLVGQRREIRELEARVATGERVLGGMKETVALLRDRHADLRDGLDRARADAHAAEIALLGGQRDAERLEQQLASLAASRVGLAGERARVTAERAAACDEHSAAALVLAAAARSVAEASDAVAASEAAVGVLRSRFAEEQAACTEARVALAAVRERVTGRVASVERLESVREEVAQGIERLELERTDAAEEAGALGAHVMDARARMAAARQDARAARAAFESARGDLDELRHGLGVREAELREMRGALEEAQAALAALELEVQRLDLERGHLLSWARERFRGLELASVVGDYHLRAPVSDAERGRMRELTELIDRMGPVHLDAMQEHAAAEQRFDHYSRNRDDLERALADLERAIHRMNRESRVRFRHAFEGINRRFVEIFPKLFRGGRAELRLTDPGDLLETGVEILAQPPGKRLSHIELMSGGEKAFTAVALLLSIFRYKPSPFCILDEVDAPLDDANTDRWLEAIRAMTDRSQFILITHSKRTMQAVDVLYGVTMQEPGVSKLVGVRVGAAQARSALQRSVVPAADDMDLGAEPPAFVAEPDAGDDDAAQVA
jgi:chromosome segregation protein